MDDTVWFPVRGEGIFAEIHTMGQNAPKQHDKCDCGKRKSRFYSHCDNCIEQRKSKG